MTRNLSKQVLWPIAMAALLLGGQVAAQSEVRSEGVVVNGEQAGLLEMLVLVAWNCGEAIPDGNYWLDVNTGAWGHAGGPQQGRMPCHESVAAGAQPADDAGQPQEDTSSTFEDRMCARGMCDGVIVNPVYP